LVSAGILLGGATTIFLPSIEPIKNMWGLGGAMRAEEAAEAEATTERR
jgi:hypothetical protein